MITALSGTTTDLNTSIRRRKEKSSTPPMKIGNRSDVPRVESRLAGTSPPTWTVRPVPPMAAGMLSSRRVSTRVSVASILG